MTSNASSIAVGVATLVPPACLPAVIHYLEWKGVPYEALDEQQQSDAILNVGCQSLQRSLEERNELAAFVFAQRLGERFSLLCDDKALAAHPMADEAFIAWWREHRFPYDAASSLILVTQARDAFKSELFPGRFGYHIYVIGHLVLMTSVEDQEALLFPDPMAPIPGLD